MPPQKQPQAQPEPEMSLRQYIDTYGETLGVPKQLRDSIFQNESGFEHYDRSGKVKTSPKGARGVGQLMPATAASLGVNADDPIENAYGSLRLQKQLYDKYLKANGDPQEAALLAAAAYNAGEGAVEKYKGVPPYAETQDYVRKVAHNLRTNPIAATTPQLTPQPQQPAAPQPLPPLNRTQIDYSGRLPQIVQPSSATPLTPPQQPSIVPASVSTTVATKAAEGAPIRQQRRAMQQRVQQARQAITRPSGLPTGGEMALPASFKKNQPVGRFAGAQVSGETQPQAPESAATIRGGLRGLAQMSGSPTQLLPQGAQDWLNEAVAGGVPALTNLAAGAVRGLPQDPTTPRSQRITEQVANQMTRGAQQVGQQVATAQADRNVVSREAQNLIAGGIGSSPAMVLTALGVPAPLAFGAQSYLESTGQDKKFLDVAKDTGMGVTIGALFEAPLPVKQELLTTLQQRLLKAGIVGSGTAALTGDPKSALINALFAGSGGAERPQESLAVPPRGATREAQPQIEAQPPVAARVEGEKPAGTQEAQVAAPRSTTETARLPNQPISERGTDMGGMGAQAEPANPVVRHSSPRIDGGEVIGKTSDGRLRVKNNEGGESIVKNPRTQGNREATIVKPQAEERRAQVNPPQGEAAEGNYPFAVLSATNPFEATVNYKNEAGKVVRQNVSADSEAELESTLREQHGLERDPKRPGMFESVTPTTPAETSATQREADAKQEEKRLTNGQLSDTVDENGIYYTNYGEPIKVGDEIKLKFAGGPTNMPKPWKLVDAENVFSTVNYSHNPRITVEAANGKRMTFDNARVYSPEGVNSGEYFDAFIKNRKPNTAAPQPPEPQQSKPQQFRDIESWKKSLTSEQAKEVQEYEDLKYKTVAGQGPKAGYKPYKLTARERARFAELDKKYSGQYRTTITPDNWRDVFDQSDSPFRKNDVLRGVARLKVSPQELAEVLDRAEQLKPELGPSLSNLFWDVSKSPSATPEIKSRATKLYEESFPPAQVESATQPPEPAPVEAKPERFKGEQEWKRELAAKDQRDRVANKWFQESDDFNNFGDRLEQSSPEYRALVKRAESLDAWNPMRESGADEFALREYVKQGGKPPTEVLEQFPEIKKLRRDLIKQRATAPPEPVSTTPPAEPMEAAPVEAITRTLNGKKYTYRDGKWYRPDGKAVGGLVEQQLNTRLPKTKEVPPEQPSQQPDAIPPATLPPQSQESATTAKPEAATEPAASTTSARKAQFAEDRAELDLPELPAAERKGWQTSLDNAKDRGLDQKADVLAREVLRKPRALNDEETAGLVLKAQQLKNDHARVSQEIGAATDPEVIKAKTAERDAIESAFDTISTATKQSGTEKGRSLASQKLTINQDFDLVSVVQRMKAAKGRDLTDAERARYEDMVKQRDAAIAERDAAIEKARTRQIDREIARAGRQRRRTESKQALDEEAAVIKQNIAAEFQRLKSAQSQTLSAGGLGALDPEGVITRNLLKYARNRVKANVEIKAEALIDEVHALVSDFVDRRQVAELISGYKLSAPEREPDDVVRLREIRSEIQKTLNAVDVAKGVVSESKQGPRLAEGVGAKEGPQLGTKQGPTLREGIGKQEGPQLGERQGPSLHEGVGRKEGPELGAKQGPRLSEGEGKPEGPSLGPKQGPSRRFISRNEQKLKQLRVKEAELQRRIDEGDFSKPERPEPLPYTREVAAQQRRVEDIERKFAREEYKATRSTGGKITDVLAKAAGVPKTIKSMGDISAVFRQGGFYAITHPHRGLAVPFRDMMRSFSDAGYRNVEGMIKSHPKFEQSVKDGVEYTGVNKTDANLSHHEENYLGDEYIDALAKGRFNLPGKALQLVKDFSERTFISFLDSQRMNMYDVMTEGLTNPSAISRLLGAKGGRSHAELKADRQRIAKAINSGTGRGNLGKTGNQIAPVLNVGMFSPRLVKSRVEILNNMFNPVAWARMPRNARAQILQDNVKFLAATAGVLALAKSMGAQVNLDPDDGDYLKIRVGDVTYDTLAGLQQPFRYIINMSRAGYARATGDETYAGKSMWEQTMGTKSRGGFLESKASPVASAIIESMRGSDYLGRKRSLGQRALDVATPLPAADVVEAFRREGLIGALKATPTFTGIGVTTYPAAPEKPTTDAEKLARKFVRDAMPDEAKAEDEIEQQQQFSDLRARARRGETIDTSRLNARQQKAIASAQGNTRFQEDFKKLTLENALTVWSVASPKERVAVKPLLERKASSIKNLSEFKRMTVMSKLREAGIAVPQ